MLKGALHIHSTYSDGDLTLAELRDVFVAAGCRFACISDHADWFDEERRRAYCDECEARSDDRFRFIASLEYPCVDRVHMLGYGVTAPIESSDPQEVIRQIRRLGGVAVVAHPKDRALQAIESFDPPPHGIEAWNSKYDGRYAPRHGPFDLVARMSTENQPFHAFYGMDFHWRRQHRRLFTLVDCHSPNRADVLAALATGRFVGVKDGDELPSNGSLTTRQIDRFDRIHRRSEGLRTVARSINTMMRGLGVGVPTSVKSELRRLF